MPRDYNHDYRSRAIYHITITKPAATPVFSTIRNTLVNPWPDHTTLGTIIKNNLRKLPQLNPRLRLLQYVIMPDHIHFLLHVTDTIDLHLGQYIGIIKNTIASEAREKLSLTGKIFDPDYYDRRLKPGQNLNDIYDYIKRNPYRLVIRRLKPQFFSRTYNFNIDGAQWQTYGNIQLLSNPFKYQVVVHRADSDDQFGDNCRRALYFATNGGVVVSPFISTREKQIRDQVLEANGKIILLTPEQFGERYRPSGRLFELCEAGKLLIIAPKDPLPPGRAGFMTLNSLAAHIAATPISRL